jgi:hypothetical protein
MVWRVSDCYWTPNQQFLQLYHGKNKLHFWWNGDDDVRFVLDQHPELDFYSPSSLKQQSTGRHCRSTLSFHTDTLFWFRTKQSLLFLINAACREATNTNFIVFGLTFGLTRSGFEPMIYCTRGEHANHYTTNAVIGYFNKI